MKHLPEATKAQPGEGRGEKGGEKGGGGRGGGELVFSGGLCGSCGDARVYEAAGKSTSVSGLKLLVYQAFSS